MFVGTGSRNEAPAQAGVSHFLEHLLFKGTDRFSSVEIDQIFDGMGAEVNAGTGKETTSVYSRFLDQHLERALDVMADMVLRPAYPTIDSERQAGLGRLGRKRARRRGRAQTGLPRAGKGAHPLGGPTIEPAEAIAR